MPFREIRSAATFQPSYKKAHAPLGRLRHNPAEMPMFFIDWEIASLP
jgi:hypothetical protein